MRSPWPALVALTVSIGCSASVIENGGDAGPWPPTGDAAEGRLDAARPADATYPANRSRQPDAAPLPFDAWPDAPESGCPDGTREEVACGVCQTGRQSRTCSGGSWSGWTACSGEDLGLPFDPVSLQVVCPPYDRPAVFFAPHPDDETIGMGAAIVEHLQVGRSVFVELLTHGDASGVRTILANGGTCSWHSGSHGYAMDAAAFGNARVAEFMEAASTLGVTGVFISDYGDSDLTTSEAGTRIGYWIARGDAGLSLKGTVGAEDPGTAGGPPNPDHAAVWDALLASGWSDVRGYFVYHLLNGAGSPDAAIDVTAWCATKRAAFEAYRSWTPGSGRYAIGYHSVSSLIDAASSGCTEYLEVP